MSRFDKVKDDRFEQASKVLSAIHTELSGWNDPKATIVKDHINNVRSSFQSAFYAAEKVEQDIIKMDKQTEIIENLLKKRS